MKWHLRISFTGSVITFEELSTAELTALLSVIGKVTAFYCSTPTEINVQIHNV